MPELDLNALPVDRIVAILKAAGDRGITAQQVQDDIAAGAPTNSDGTLNLLAYGAWMLRELGIKENKHGP